MATSHYGMVLRGAMWSGLEPCAYVEVLSTTLSVGTCVGEGDGAP